MDDKSTTPLETEAVEAEAVAKTEELSEERKAADGQPRKLTALISAMPKIRKNQSGQVTSVIVEGKVKFKGTVTLHMRGDVASAYWSVTPGMSIVALAIERPDGEYDVEHMDVLRPVDA